jgi:hypothetical protein
MEEEEAVGVVLLLDAFKTRVIVAPERVLPVRFEVVRLPDVGGGACTSLRSSSIEKVQAFRQLRKLGRSTARPNQAGMHGSVN